MGQRRPGSKRTFHWAGERGARQDGWLMAARVVGKVVDCHDAIRVDGCVSQEVFKEIVTEDVRAAVAEADELHHELERRVKRGKVGGVELIRVGLRLRDLVLLAADDGGGLHALKVRLEMRLDHAAHRKVRAYDDVQTAGPDTVLRRNQALIAAAERERRSRIDIVVLPGFCTY